MAVMSKKLYYKVDLYAASGSTSRKMKSVKAPRWISGVCGELNSSLSPSNPKSHDP